MVYLPENINAELSMRKLLKTNKYTFLLTFYLFYLCLITPVIMITVYICIYVLSITNMITFSVTFDDVSMTKFPSNLINDYKLHT